MATKITIVNEARHIDIVERALKDQNMDFTKAVKDNGLHVVFDVAGDFSFEGNFSPSWLLGFSKEIGVSKVMNENGDENKRYSSKVKGKRAKTGTIDEAGIAEAEMIADIGGHTVSGLIDE